MGRLQRGPLELVLDRAAVQNTVPPPINGLLLGLKVSRLGWPENARGVGIIFARFVCKTRRLGFSAGGLGPLRRVQIPDSGQSPEIFPPFSTGTPATACRAIPYLNIDSKSTSTERVYFGLSFGGRSAARDVLPRTD